MRFFTLDVVYPANEEAEGGLRTACDRYAHHLEAMRGVLPDAVLALAALPGVDDGLVVEVHHIRSQQVLVLILRCGDLQMGYYDLVLTYQVVAISSGDEWMLARIARMTRDGRRAESDLAFHELDTVDDGRIEHRILFHRGVWFSIRCRELHWEKIDRPDRELPSLPDRFPGGPASPRGAFRRRWLKPETFQA